MKISASIVLHRTNKEVLRKVVDSFFATEIDYLRLYLVDNSRTDELSCIVEDYPNNNIEYIFNNANLGYGKAHNIAIRKAIKLGSVYHVILNPDIYFKSNVIATLVKFMNKNMEVGNIMPQIKYPNGDIQHLCKLLPTPVDLIFRRFIPLKSWKEKRNKGYELHNSGYDKTMNVPNLSGCFMCLRVGVLKKIGLFDENIFMYLEDVDLNRRIHTNYKTLFYPKVEIVHEYAKESYKSKKLLIAHIKSAIYYFNKWGWLFDKERSKINEQVIKEIGNAEEDK